MLSHLLIKSKFSKSLHSRSFKYKNLAECIQHNFKRSFVCGGFPQVKAWSLSSSRLCPSTAGCSPPSVSSIVVCLLLSLSRWFPPSLLRHLAIFCLVDLLISSLSFIATLCSIWSTYCPSFLPYDWPNFHFCFRVYSMKYDISYLCCFPDF